MPHGHGLVSQSLRVDNVALLTLAAKTALLINGSLQSIKSTFLMKRIRHFLQLTGRTADDNGPIIVGCARGDASVSEINAALTEFNPTGPEDVTQSLTEDSAWVVFHNTIVPLVPKADQTFAMSDPQWMSFGGKNGIPALEDVGMQVFVYNSGSSALTTGSLIEGNSWLQGVWLRG